MSKKKVKKSSKNAKSKIRERIAAINEEAILFDDLDDAIIGIGHEGGGPTVAIYDRNKCIEILAKSYMNDGVVCALKALTMAQEYFEHNVECLYAGEHTPIIIKIFEDEK